MAKFSKSVSIDSISKLKPREQSLEAKADELEYIADRLEILEVKNLKADVTLEKKNGAVKVLGSFKADIIQACIVSLEPIDEHVEEKFETWFTDIKPEYLNSDVDEILMPSEEEAPEYIEDGNIDIAETVIQYLSLAMDPYPRLKEANKNNIIKQENEVKNNPFAVLKDLKDE